jgi:DHA1 family multidrug resistance protein-like MFS transporter
MHSWKKTFVSSFIAQIFSIVGFSFALPFIPFFIGELGVADQARQTWWAGVVIAASGLAFAAFAPLWGSLADIHGRKLMVMRAMFGGTIVLTLMSFVQTVPQLIVCRILQGALTGTIAASVALVASVSPDRRSGFTLGMMQTAVYLGISLGPLFGGAVADRFGYRIAFRVGALVVFAGGLLVLFGTREAFSKPDGETKRKTSYLSILKSPGFLSAVAVLLSIRFSNTMANPSFPLIVENIMEAGSKLNTVTGSILATAAITGAVSSALLGHFGDSWGHRRMLIACSLAAAAASYGHALAMTVPQMFVARGFFGLAIGGMIPAANAMIKKSIHHAGIGKAYGAATSISMLGVALGPFMGGYIGSVAGLRVPFMVMTGSQLVVCLMVAALMRNPKELSAS